MCSLETRQFQSFLFGFFGNQPFLTRSRWSKTSFMLQKQVKAKTPVTVDQNIPSIRSDTVSATTPATRKHHQHFTPKQYSHFITIG